MSRKIRLDTLCAASASLDVKKTCKEIGRDLTVLPGEVAEIVINNLVEDESKCGFSAVVQGGGVLLLKLSSAACQNRRNKTSTVLDDAQRTKLLALLASWPATECSLRQHAMNTGIPLAEVRKACFANPGRTPPPLRMEYEQSRARWRDAYNNRRSRRPNA